MTKNENRVAVMATVEGQPLILRANPTLEEVRGFVREHNRRNRLRIAGGPSGLPARKIISASYYEVEGDSADPTGVGVEIDISDVLSEQE